MKCDNIVKQIEDPAACVYVTAPSVRSVQNNGNKLKDVL